MKRVKAFGLLAIVAGMMVLAGCQTTKNAAVGTACTVGATAVGAAQDTATAYGGIMAADDWIKKTLW